MSDATDKPAGKMSLRKATAGSTPADGAPPATKPRQVELAVGALVLSALAAVIAAVSLYGQKSWLISQQVKANNKAITKAGKDAITDATNKHLSSAQIEAAGAKARASTAKDLSDVSHQVAQQQRGALIGALLVALVVAFLAYGVYRGRHWSRWGVSAFWLLASFTGTFVSLMYLLSVAADVPGVFKGATFIAALSMVVAVVLVNMRVSTQYFALSRPVPPAGAPPRRGLFGPRPAPTSPRGGAAQRGGPAQRAGGKGILTSTAATRGEAYVERQRAKKRAAANAESVARGAELARSRAKASKSRRVER